MNRTSSVIVKKRAGTKIRLWLHNATEEPISFHYKFGVALSQEQGGQPFALVGQLLRLPYARDDTLRSLYPRNPASNDQSRSDLDTQRPDARLPIRSLDRS